MKRVTILDEAGNKQNALIAENNDEVKHIVMTEKKAIFRENLYIGYLIIGTIAFSLGILITLKRLNGK